MCTVEARTSHDQRATTTRNPSVAALVCGLLSAAVFAGLTTQASTRLAGAMVIGLGAAIVTQASHRVLGATLGLGWSAVAVGAAAQIRLDPSVTPRTLMVVAAAALLVPLAQLVTAWAMARHDPGRVSGHLRWAVALLCVTFVARLAPVLVGRLASGALPVPFLGSVQVGELTRPVFILAVALGVDALVRAGALSSWDRSTGRLAGLGSLAALGYLGLLVVVDSGPAALTAAAVVVIVVRCWPQLRVAWRRARWTRPAPLRRGLAHVALILLGCAAATWYLVRRLGTVDRWSRRLSGLTEPEQQVTVAVLVAREGGLVGSGLGSSSLVTYVPVASSDMIAATLAAELGLGVVAMLAAGVVLLLGRASRAAAAQHGPLPTAALAASVALIAQLAFAVLGGLGLIPLTGVSAPLLVVGGSSLLPVAGVLGMVLGTVPAAPATPGDSTPAPRPARSLAAAIVVGCLSLTLLPPPPGDGWSTVMRPRGAVLTRDGEIIAQATIDGTNPRVYPQGALYADLGALVPGHRAYGVESVVGADLTCGGATTGDRLAAVLHPVPCRPADVVTTIDANVQHAVADAMVDADGSAVVLDSHTGEVLALYSTGQVDPNDLEPAAQAPAAPSRRAALSPGSALKPLVAVVALTYGVTTTGAPSTVLAAGDEQLRNLRGSVCPDTSLAGALATSCNTVFGYLGIKLGADRLGDGLDRWFGQVPYDGGDLAQLHTGLTATARPGQVARTAIGQEGVTTSPLALTGAMAAIVWAADHDGPAPAPHVTGAVCNGATTRRSSTATWGESIDPQAAQRVLEGMKRATTSGTLRDLGDAAEAAGRQVVGKSGTADVSLKVSSSGILHWASVVVDDRWAVTVAVRGNGATNGAADVAARLFNSLPTDLTPVGC